MYCAVRSAFAGRSGAQRNEEIANGEGVASGSAILIAKNLKKSWVFRQSPFARKALCTTGRAGPLACAAAAVYPAIHNPRPAAAHQKYIIPIYYVEFKNRIK